ncbi:MAG: endonuclease/exonuclease/phosphatase family protein [Bacteroidota bacterium]
MTKHFLIALIFFTATQFSVKAQKQFCVGFYNQENLFDTIDDPHKNDNEFLPAGKNSWNTEKYLNKLDHMSRVIASMNDGKGADVLGMCEVENSAVLKDLTATATLRKIGYGFVHFEGPDERSIDNALLYQSKKISVLTSVAYPVIFNENLNSKTRDILLVKLLDKKTKASFIVLVNHFPSRLGGETESAPKRNNAASILRGIYDSISKADPSMPVLMVGDFNDYPSNESMGKVLNAKAHIAELNSNDLFNAMYELHEQKKGSHYYRGEWGTLDQIIMSNNIVNCTGKVCYKPASVTIYKQDWMLEQEGKYKGAPLRTFAGSKYTNGYSDHLPVYVILELRK